MNITLVKEARGLTEKAACRRLRLLASHVRPDRAVVELGAFQGRTTAWLALGASSGCGAHVWSVDTWDTGTTHPEYASDWEPGYQRGDYEDPTTFDRYLAHLDRTGAAEHVTWLRTDTLTAAQQWDGGPPVGLLWHDAQHTQEAVESDLRAWSPHMASESTIVLHDACHPAYGVAKGAHAALDPDVWDLPGTVDRWSKKPNRRGTLTIRHR